MASTYSPDQQQFVQFYSPPPVASARPEASRSPWSASSTDSFSLALPSLTPGDLAEADSLYDRLQSPSDFLPAPQAIAVASQLQSQPQPPLSTPQQLQQNFELYEEFESPDIFLNFDDHYSPPRYPHSPITRTSSIVDLTSLPPVEMAPPSKKRKPSVAETETTSKRSRVFSEVETKPLYPHTSEVEVLDMVDVDDDQKYEDFKSKQQAEFRKQQNQEKADKPVKLSEFQCIICLDNPTDLTVTHCGHLFCSRCLHDALHSGSQRKTCPVCRSTITGKKGKESKQPKLGVFVLEMKLMTARRKEKQPENTR